MTSFDFLKKLYKTSKSAVIINNTANTIFWSTNLNKLGIKEEDVKSEKAKEYFNGKYTYELYPGETVAHVNGSAYPVNVKTFADRSNEFVIIEIRTETFSHAFINDNELAKLIDINSVNLRINAGDIISTLDRLKENDATLDDQTYENIIYSIRRMLNTNRNLYAIADDRFEEFSYRNGHQNNLSEVCCNLVEECEKVLNPKNIQVDFACIENILSTINERAIKNVILSMINRAFCISKGYVDKIVIGLEMLNSTVCELSVSTECESKATKISDQTELEDRMSMGDCIGSDLFAIRYFCEKYHSEATQKINHEELTTSLIIKMPYCESSGIMLFNSNEFVPKERLSEVSIALSEVTQLLN